MDLYNLDVKTLRLFELLYTTGSVTRTADMLGCSQPTVSIGLARLRKQFNDPLFVRTALTMQPTPKADALVTTVREVLDGLRRLSEAEQRFEPAEADRTFRIFMTDASHITLLPQLFTHVRAIAPKVKLEAASIGPQMVNELQSGEGDLALGLIPGLEAGFYQQVLFEQNWVCLSNPRHSRLKRGLTLDAYVQADHVGIIAGTGQLLLEAALKQHGIDRNVALKLPGFLGLSAILQSTDMVATLPQHIGETLARSAGLKVWPCPIPIPSFTVKQHWHARYHHDPANRWLRSMCAELFLRLKP
ncbi:LysR family transcriptional regulator [Hydrogenophaga aquatica]